MFDFLGLKNQSIQFLLEMGGHDMGGEDFFKWIIVKNEIENEIIKQEEANKKEKNRLNMTNQKIKYDQLSDELEKNIGKIMELWKLVMEENTKVRTIRNQLHKVTQGLRQLEIFWDREKKFLDNIPKCQVLFGLFLKDSIYEVDRGEDMIKKALEELDKRKQLGLNFDEIESSANFEDMEKAIAFIKITKKTTNSYIENCSITFAKFFNTVRRNLIGTMICEYMPQEFIQSFIESAIKQSLGSSKGKSIISDQGQKFPFLTYHGRLLKEFFIQRKVIMDQNGESILALNLKMDNDYSALKMIVSTESLAIRYINSCKLI